MTRPPLEGELRMIADAVGTKVNLSRWYLFGSALERPQVAADIDVVVICGSDADADAIRRFVNAYEIYPPLHLSILTEEEEAEIDFVARQGCVQIR